MDGTVRKRVWNHKVKTGCKTCRIRKVKCDEGRPTCRRCVIGRRECVYFTVPVASRNSNQKTQEQPQLQWRLQAEAEPPDWDLTQAVHYYYSVIKPASPGLADPPFYHPNFTNCRFICQMLCDQVGKGSRTRKKLLSPGEDPAFAGLWTKFYRYLGESIAIVNRCLQEKGPGRLNALTGIIYLIFNDLCMKTSSWQNHINGYLATVEHMGGITQVLKMPKPPLGTLNLLLMMGTPLNTTTPANQRVRGFDKFSDEQLRTVFSFAYEPDMPCPTDFLIAMVHITRFRAILAGADGDHTKDRNAPGSKDEISGKVLEIFDTLECFDLDKWAKGVTAPYDTTELPAVGRVFALAIRLYCILTLPSLAEALAGSSAASGHSRYPDLCAYDGLRIQYREQLIVQLRDIWDRIEYQGGIAWPLIVAGVAATDSVEQNRDFIDQCLWEIWNKPSAGATFIIALEKLRIFWRSGKSGWEDCFDEPTPCYP